MVDKLVNNLTSLIICGLITSSCSSNIATTEKETQITQSSESQNILRLEANGEDFVRQGFVTKDGWQIDFTHVYVTLAEVIAYQTNPPFDAEQETPLSAIETVKLVDQATTIDLAQANPNPVVVAEAQTNLGVYNALSWQVVPNTSENASIILEGIAQKENQSIDFIISFDQTLKYVCGEFVGESRKGIVSGENSGTVETTFHFDHIFGDAETPLTEALNEDALGFQPLANLTKNGQLRLNMTTLKQQLSTQDYEKLQKAFISLGHVGEGHCRFND